MAVNVCTQNCTEDATGFLFEMISGDISFSWNEYSYFIAYNPWFFSILGSTMVGLAGILPLLVIPIEEGADLKNGANAGTLKLLLSFAVGGLLGDVFLHLLPEAWENDSLKRAANPNLSSMPCGLWVLSGFLVFVIVEKIFAFDHDPDEIQTEDDHHQQQQQQSEIIKKNLETEKEMENNNCINVIGVKHKNGYDRRFAANELSEMEPFLEKISMKNGYIGKENGIIKEPKTNGFLKSGYKNGIILSDGMSADEVMDCLNKLTKNNGFSSSSSSSSSSSLLNGCIIDKKQVSSNTKEVFQQTVVDAVVTKTRPKHIAGYLNLMANCIDNFTHGLAVGGSFLMSFRLGALTTFAILVHEIPHEVGDFAILLRSGFSRWDAAKAQLLTATGGIFGSLAALVFSGGEVEARTSWILPFTAGGFLHIGLVTILPELLKESSPKESLKQLATLLFGTTLMAMLTILCD